MCTQRRLFHPSCICDESSIYQSFLNKRIWIRNNATKKKPKGLKTNQPKRWEAVLNKQQILNGTNQEQAVMCESFLSQVRSATAEWNDETMAENDSSSFL